MKLVIFKTVQVACWVVTVALLIAGLCRPEWLKEQRENYLGLLECLSVAAIGLSQYIENKKEKFSAANVVALGYITNFIKPIVDEQVKQFNASGGTALPKDIYIFIPETVAAVEDRSVDRLLANNKIVCEKVSVPVSTRGRATTDIGKIIYNDKGGFYYFDVPNTITSLQTLIDYKLGKKANTTSAEKRKQLETEYVSLFKIAVQELINKMELVEYVKVVGSVGELPK